MLNIVFIIVVLVLQMQKDCLHIEWPFGPKFNHTIVPCNSNNRERIWVVSRLQLEPIGLLFLVFYMSILVIQVCNPFFNCKMENQNLFRFFIFAVYCNASSSIQHT